MPITKPDKERLIKEIRKELLLLENSKEIRFVAGIVFKINIRRSVRSQLEKITMGTSSFVEGINKT